jgi:hypothetical protein
MEEHRLRMFENRVQRKIFGPKREDVTSCWMEPVGNLQNSKNG